MKKLDYYVLDVFTDQKYKGNQLSVVYCEDPLETRQYYEIAREFGYSETSFVHYSSVEKAFKVRSFTPGNYEVIGAGHNLLGAVCLALLKGWNIFREQQGEPYVIIKDQKIPLSVTKINGLPYVAMKQRPAVIHRTVPDEIIAPAVGLTIEALNLNNWQTAVVETEVAHLMVPVKNSDYLKQVNPNKELLKKISGEYGFEGCYLFTTAHDEKSYIAETRFFNPGIGIDEDAATGTAAGPLAGYLNKLNYLDQGKDVKILQGVELNHPSSIHIKVVPEGIWISGSSVITMEGVIYL